ncbi:unnamed protein product [Cuscuta campestris]|uniref:CBS domain-containing protein n=2 Tax=Cuscuta sect. Cleistogrammica TaxID=1824901 RepID=A0A484MM03_9ASTE|nr:hypothetical protein DM860_002958 [Cuscuta australis]VFQ89517.1 unnamed protein product [Cuscuta campestris]
MAVRFLNQELSDLCLGKPVLRPVKEASSIAEAVAALKRSGEAHVSVWRCSDHSREVPEGEDCRCVGKICMVDVICYLCKEENLGKVSEALEAPVSEILPKGVPIVRHMEPDSSLLEAIDCILEGTQNLIIPIQQSYSSSHSRRKQHLSSSSNHHGVEYCWLTQEDVVRFLLNSIGVFSPLPTFTIESLGIISRDDTMTIPYHEPAANALSSVTRAHIQQTSIAVVDDDTRLIGEISPSTLSYCDETVAAAVMTLSAGDLMAYIDCGGPTEDLVELVKQRAGERNLGALLGGVMEEEYSVSSISSSSASSCSSDDESLLSKSSGSGNYYCLRRSEAITCYPWSSLVAVMIQALAHRASSIWVIQEDQSLVGIVTYKEMLRVFRSIANPLPKPKPGRNHSNHL